MEESADLEFCDEVSNSHMNKYLLTWGFLMMSYMLYDSKDKDKGPSSTIHDYLLFTPDKFP